jgi:hypothetical protein
LMWICLVWISVMKKRHCFIFNPKRIIGITIHFNEVIAK